MQRGNLTSSLEPLRRRDFRLLWLSSAAWYCGRNMDVIVAGWLALQLTGSAWDVALIGFYRTVPVPVFGVFAGAIADRLDRRRLVMVSGLANVTASLTIAGLYTAGQLEYWHLAAANLVLGLAWSLDWPSRRAILPDLVSRDQLMPAIVVDTLSMNVNKIVGPVLGGAVLALSSVPVAYGLLAAIYLAGMAPVLALALQKSRQVHSMPVLPFIVEGLRFSARYQAVRGVLLITVIMNWFAFPYIQLLPVFAQDILQVGPVGLGVLGAADGIGSLICSVGLMSSGRFRHHGWIFVLGSAGMCAALVVFAASPVYALSFALLILGGIGHTGFSTFQSGIILGAVGDALRGRAMGVLTLAIGSTPLGMVSMGALAGAMGAPWAVGLCSVTGAALIAATALTTPGLLAQRARAERRTIAPAQREPAT